MLNETPFVKELDHPDEIKSQLRRLERSDVWSWWNAILVITALAGAIAALSIPTHFDGMLPVSDEVAIAVRGLLGLVLIFNIYTLYQQYLLRLLRRSLANEIELSTARKVRAETLYEMAVIDPLTGLYNRRYSEERLKNELARTPKAERPLIVVAFDLDNFKEINDLFGHSAGDQVLQEFARRLGDASRGSDFAVRTGGDEFLLVLPGCQPASLKLILSRLSPLEFDFAGQNVVATSSHGWVQHHPGESANELLRRADEALYTAKRIDVTRPFGTSRRESEFTRRTAGYTNQEV